MADQRDIDKALDRYLTPVVAVGFGIAVIYFVVVNFWPVILGLALLGVSGLIAWANREQLMSFFSGLFGPPKYVPPPAPRPHPEYSTRLGQALQLSLERENIPLPPNDIFTMALRIGAKLVNDETYSLPEVLRPDYNAEKDEEERQELNMVLRATGQTPSPIPRRIGPAEMQAMREVYSDIAERAGDVVFQSLLVYLKNFPPCPEAPFSAPIATRINFAHVIYEMLKPFREDQTMISFKLIPSVRRVFDNNVQALPPTNGELTYPQHFQGPPEQLPEVYLKGHPFRPLFNVMVPFQPFTEINRCAHHWCLGKTRRGKTTFLRHLIKHDLEEVAKGNCSLIVMDSKNLVREMRTLNQFAPGEDLDGRLILIDSDYPFPLNPFQLPREQARATLTYMLGNMQNASELQGGALGFYVDAVLQSKNKSIQTILDYVRLNANKGEMPREIDRFDKLTADWFRHTKKTLHSATSGGLEQRLTNFLREHQNSPLMKMLSADSWGLDLYDEIHGGGKVLLVDTDRLANGDEGINLLGRLFISLIDQLATRRMRNPGKPVWCYIDEASDYLVNDKAFVQILVKAAGAKVGMTVAYQFKGMPGIGDDVEKALNNAEIHSVCEQRGTVQLTVEERPLTLPNPQLEFDREPQMNREEYKQLREQLAKEYPYRTVPPPKDGSEQPLTQKF